MSPKSLAEPLLRRGARDGARCARPRRRPSRPRQRVHEHLLDVLRCARHVGGAAGGLRNAALTAPWVSDPVGVPPLLTASDPAGHHQEQCHQQQRPADEAAPGQVGERDQRRRRDGQQDAENEEPGGSGCRGSSHPTTVGAPGEATPWSTGQSLRGWHHGSMTGFHHVEVWVADLAQARSEWGWLLEELGFSQSGEWVEGESWSAGGAYLTLTTSPNLSGAVHDRRAPGVNHLAFIAGRSARVDEIMRAAPEHGWRPLYQERYPHAGGSEHYAGWLENSAGFKA